MGYNHHHAFHPTTLPQLTREQFENIRVGAIFAFQQEFPDTTTIELKLLPETKHIEAQADGEYRLYSWKQLGVVI